MPKTVIISRDQSETKETPSEASNKSSEGQNSRLRLKWTPPTVEKRKALADKDLEINGELKEPRTKRQKTGLRQKTPTLIACRFPPGY